MRLSRCLLVDECPGLVPEWLRVRGTKSFSVFDDARDEDMKLSETARRIGILITNDKDFARKYIGSDPAPAHFSLVEDERAAIR